MLESSISLSDTKFKKAALTAKDITATFNKQVCHSKVCDDVKEKTLSDIISTFFKIRAHSKAKKIMEQYRINKHVSAKQKSLRKSLKRAADAN